MPKSGGQKANTGGREIRKQRKLDYKKWAKKTHYGDRWVATEGKFSVVKRKIR